VDFWLLKWAVFCLTYVNNSRHLMVICKTLRMAVMSLSSMIADCLHIMLSGIRNSVLLLAVWSFAYAWGKSVSFISHNKIPIFSPVTVVTRSRFH
jgi:hypothetical protein